MDKYVGISFLVSRLICVDKQYDGSIKVTIQIIIFRP